MKMGERAVAQYLVERYKKALHSFGKIWCSIYYASLVSWGWSYLGQIIRIRLFSTVSVKPSSVAFYICFPWIYYFFWRMYSPERRSSSWLWNVWGCTSKPRPVGSPVLWKSFLGSGHFNLPQASTSEQQNIYITD